MACAGFIAAYNAGTCMPEFRLLAALHAAHPELRRGWSAAADARRTTTTPHRALLCIGNSYG